MGKRLKVVRHYKNVMGADVPIGEYDMDDERVRDWVIVLVVNGNAELLDIPDPVTETPIKPLAKRR